MSGMLYCKEKYVKVYLDNIDDKVKRYKSKPDTEVTAESESVFREREANRALEVGRLDRGRVLFHLALCGLSCGSIFRFFKTSKEVATTGQNITKSV